MSNSELLKMYKALEGVVLAQRVHGAVIKKAHYTLGDSNADPTGKAFAALTLEDPMRKWQEMLIEVVANGTIQENLSIDPSGNIDDRNVPDSDIEYVVGEAWTKVAAKVLPSVV